MSKKEILSKSIAILQTMVERHHRSQGKWTEALWPISFRSHYRNGAPDAESPEVTLLLELGLLKFIRSAIDPDVPDDCLRLISDDVPKVESIIERYVSNMDTAGILEPPIPASQTPPQPS